MNRQQDVVRGSILVQDPDPGPVNKRAAQGHRRSKVSLCMLERCNLPR